MLSPGSSKITNRNGRLVSVDQLFKIIGSVQSFSEAHELFSGERPVDGPTNNVVAEKLDETSDLSPSENPNEKSTGSLTKHVNIDSSSEPLGVGDEIFASEESVKSSEDEKNIEIAISEDVDENERVGLSSFNDTFWTTNLIASLSATVFADFLFSIGKSEFLLH